MKVEPSSALITLVEWRSWISFTFSWFYQGTTAVFFFYMMFILYRFGHIHLGPPQTRNDPPEFSTPSYMCMCFTSGIASGFFAVSVSQTMWNQTKHYYAQAGYHSQDELDLFAINLTVTQWGFAGWTKYLVVAVNMALAMHCFGLPAALRSCFYPILRHYTWGWMGDCVDGLAIVASITGVAVSMGLGAVQIVSGFVFMGWVDANASERQITSIQGATIWVITVFFTASVLSGLRGGVLVVSKLALSFNFIFVFLIFVLDDSKFLLNLIIQETGYYMQYSMFQLNFWTDAFGQLREGSGRAVDGKASDQGWMDAWAVFYAAWWVAWAPFVGLFVATISKGRKLWEVVVYGLFIPVGYCLTFFSVMGGVGLRQSRQALELQQLGVTYFNNSAHFLSSNSLLCYDVPQEHVEINDTTVFTNFLPGVTPVCLFDESNSEFAAYNVFNSFRFPGSFQGDGLGTTLSFLFIVASTLHSIRSCDTASLVVDNLASTGRKHSHWVSRVFWAITLGSLASALLTTGGSTALQAIQAASVLCGLPFTVLLCFMLQSILLMCRAAEQPAERCKEYWFPVQPEFEMPLYGGVFNALEFIASLGKVNTARIRHEMHQPKIRHVVEFCKGLAVPFVSLYQILTALYPTNPVSNAFFAGIYMACYLGWIGFMSASRLRPQFVGLGWTLFLSAGGLLCHVRSNFRANHKIRSNGIADVLSACFFWPQVLTQLQIQCDMVSAVQPKSVCRGQAINTGRLDSVENDPLLRSTPCVVRPPKSSRHPDAEQTIGLPVHRRGGAK